MTQQISLAGGNDGGSRRSSFRHKPDGKLDPAGEVGWFLQYERERRGDTLADAAAETRIKATYIHALEQGAMDQLPGWPYVIGYVRSYAKFLGLEAEPLVEHYQSFLDKPAVIDRVGSRSAWWRQMASMRAAAALVGIVSVAVVGFWAVFQDGPLLTARTTIPDDKPVLALTPQNDDPLSVNASRLVAEATKQATVAEPAGGNQLETVREETKIAVATPLDDTSTDSAASDNAPEITGAVAPLPREKPQQSVVVADRQAALDAALPTVRVKQKTLENTPAAAAGEQSVSQSDVETALAIDGTTPENRIEPADLTRLIASTLKDEAGESTTDSTPTETTITPAAAKPSGSTSGSSKEPAGRVVLRARSNVWLRIEDQAGDILYSQTLAQGESYPVPDGKGLVLIVRDAGALEYSIDKKPFAVLGQPGQILVGHPLAAGKIAKAGG